MKLSVYRKNSKYWDMYVWANNVDSDQTALKEQSDQDLHCLQFFLHLLEALLHRKIKLFYIKDNYNMVCVSQYLEFLRYIAQVDDNSKIFLLVSHLKYIQTPP